MSAPSSFESLIDGRRLELWFRDPVDDGPTEPMAPLVPHADCDEPTLDEPAAHDQAETLEAVTRVRIDPAAPVMPLRRRR
jgi:hypothetical protein